MKRSILSKFLICQQSCVKDLLNYLSLFYCTLHGLIVHASGYLARPLNHVKIFCNLVPTDVKKETHINDVDD